MFDKLPCICLGTGLAATASPEMVCLFGLVDVHMCSLGLYVYSRNPCRLLEMWAPVFLSKLSWLCNVEVSEA